MGHDDHDDDHDGAIELDIVSSHILILVGIHFQFQMWITDSE